MDDSISYCYNDRKNRGEHLPVAHLIPAAAVHYVLLCKIANYCYNTNVRV